MELKNLLLASLALGIEYYFLLKSVPVKQRFSLYYCLTLPSVVVLGYFSSWNAPLVQIYLLLLVTLFYLERCTLIQSLGRVLVIEGLLQTLYPFLFLGLAPFLPTPGIVCLTYVITYFLITQTKLLAEFETENNKLYFALIVYLYLLSFGLNYLTNFTKQEREWVPLFYLFFLSQFLFVSWLYLTGKKQLQIAVMLQQITDLKNYTKQLEAAQQNLRHFKHDQQNLLMSLQISAKNDHDKELLKQLQNYSQTYLEDELLWRFNDIYNVHDEVLKSLLLNKLNLIFQKNIKSTFECQKPILPLADRMLVFDLVRILGIVYDNAFEESLLLGKEAEIRSMLYREKNTFEFEIRNRCQPLKRPLSELKCPNVTTKEGHQGLGLAEIEQIKEMRHDLLVEYRIVDGWFIFVLVIDSEGSYEKVCDHSL